MRISLSITSYSWPDRAYATQLARMVRAADAGGLDTVWVADHLLQAAPSPGRGRDARGLHHARLPGRADASASGSARWSPP